jgi:hypothetical protein
MINDRPKHLLAQDDYKKLPAKPFAVQFDALPSLVREALGPLGGIQPVTSAMAKAANGQLTDLPSEGEIKLFKERGTLFQPVFLVLSIAHLKDGGTSDIATPYALSLMPTSKRGVIDEKDIDLVSKLDVQKILDAELCYVNFDPFTGDRGLFGPLGSFLGEHPINCFLDELGIVVGQYFLSKEFEPADVMEVPMGFTNPKSEEKYKKHRGKLLYTTFTEIKPRRVWGAQSPIELFLFQELLRRSLSPTLQVIMFDDGSIHPSLYDFWHDLESQDAPGHITEPDMYFAENKLAVFCDSAKHHGRAKDKAKDAAIDKRLATIGVNSVRIPGPLIVNDLKSAADLVAAALETKPA